MLKSPLLYVCIYCRFSSSFATYVEDKVEDEFHVVMHCPVYNDLRRELLSKFDQVFKERLNMDDDELFKLIMSHENTVKFTASYPSSIT